MSKILWLVTCISILMVAFSCSTKLEIANETSFTLDLISWIDEDGDTHWFGRDMVWDNVLQTYVQGMYPGSSEERKVDPGVSPVYFWFAAEGPEYRTIDWVIVEKNKHESYSLTDNTLVVEAGMKVTKPLNDISVSVLTTTKEDIEKRHEDYMKMRIEK